MEGKILFNQGNKVQVKFDFEHETQKSKQIVSLESKKYRCGTVSFQIQIDSVRGNYIDYATVSARFVKSLPDDQLSYVCKLNSAAFEIYNIALAQENIWHKIRFYTRTSNSESFKFTFDITVESDIAHGEAPFEALYDDDILADFEMKGDDGGVSFHRQILAASSPVLKVMVSGEWKENKESSNKVHFAVNTLRHFKDYIYLNKLPKQETDIKNLLLIGSYYIMPILVQKCIVKLLHNLNSKNVIDLIEFASTHKVTNLLVFILKHTQSNTVRVDDVKYINFNEMCENVGGTLE